VTDPLGGRPVIGGGGRGDSLDIAATAISSVVWWIGFGSVPTISGYKRRSSTVAAGPAIPAG
jgi:hypothetical protein